MNKKNIITVLAAVVSSALLIVGLAVWLGPEPTAVELSQEYDAAGEAITPLTIDEQTIANGIMTNEQNPVAKVVTSRGTFELELFEDTMPITAGNFVKLAEEKFYDGIKFHRVIDGFMIQGGDPLTKTSEVFKWGTGGPGYSIPDEHIAGEYLTNVRGTISMANSGPNSGGSQFFINVADNTNLDFDKPPASSKHPVFGRVLSGMEVVDAISKADTNQADQPVEPIVIESVTIVRK